MSPPSPSPSPSPSIKHPSLGPIHGTTSPRHAKVAQYLGIQYATLANRFARGTLVEASAASSSSPPIEATKLGPLPVADPENCANEHLLLQHALPVGKFQFSDTECLTLNVSVPARPAQEPKPEPLLPVVAFVHGGGFVTGSANWPQYDLAPLVERSVAVGKPVIAVGINYRLGPFGFLNSSAMREAGFLPNNGLHDQKLALRWIQKYIRGFGGNPEQVTYLGSSMGATSGFHHLQSEEPLFRTLVALGGNPLIQPLPLAVGDLAFSAVTSLLGLTDLAPADQVQSLLSLPAQELSAKLAHAPLPINALLDNDIVKAIPSYTTIAAAAAATGGSEEGQLSTLFPGTKWCKTIHMGDSQLDGMVFDVTVLQHRPDNLPDTLIKSLAAVFRADSDALVTPLVQAYGIDATAALLSTDSKSEREKAKLPVIHFLNDIVFAQGAKATARAWSRQQQHTSKAYLSHFNMPNPWAGPWQGVASHALDIVIVLGTYNEFLSAGQKACAEHMTDDFLRLAYGRDGDDPFPPYQDGDGNGKSMVYFAEVDSEKEASQVVKDADASLTKRRAILEEVAGGKPEVLDQYLAAFGLFMQGGPK